MLTQEEVKNGIFKLYENKGQFLTEHDLKKAHLIHQFKTYFGKNLAAGFEKIGIPCSPLAEKYSISDEKLLLYLRDLRNFLGFVPGTYEVQHDSQIYKKYASLPFSWSIFKKRFGGFPQALKEAGLTAEKNDSTAKPNVLDVISVQEEVNVQLSEIENFDNRKRYWGKGAEIHLMAELLYHGYQPSNISVDEGIDVIATKNNKTFCFQVKHKDLSNYAPVELTKSTYTQKSGSDYYLVIVLLSNIENERKFLIIPWSFIDKWIEDGSIVDSGKKYQIKITKEEGIFKLGSEILTRYLGIEGWKKIK
jgi:hypothetical protein